MSQSVSDGIWTAIVSKPLQKKHDCTFVLLDAACESYHKYWWWEFERLGVRGYVINLLMFHIYISHCVHFSLPTMKWKM